MIISQADALRAIKMLTKVSDGLAGLGPSPHVLEDELNSFLFDDSGNPRFEERDLDPSPMCRCEECPMGGPYTCVSTD